jgi:predicted transcriptional regulator of viral defense system
MTTRSTARPHSGHRLDSSLERSISSLERSISSLERSICSLALDQHAVAAVEQIVALGLSASTLRSRVAAGRLHRLHIGVVAIVPPVLLTRRGRIMGAVLACAPGAAATVRAAAELHGLRLAGRSWIDVAVPGTRGYRRDGVHVHSGATLSPDDIVKVDGIRCTTLARTLLDLADVLTRRELERAIDRAGELRVLDMAAIDDVLERAGRRRGAAALRAVLAEHRVGSTPTRNTLEEAFLALARRAGLPPDAVNMWIPYPHGSGAEADFAYRAERLDIEVDGRDVHTARRAFEHDRRRDQQLALLGWQVVRFTWRQVLYEPAAVARTLGGLLSTRARRRS